jgi:hypothetical protein
VLSFPYHPRLRSPNELSRLMQTRAIVDFKELDLNRTMRLYGPVGDLSVVGTHYYPSKAPLMSFAAVPVYALLRAVSGGRAGVVPEIPLVFWSRFFLTVAPTLAMLVMLQRFLASYVPVEIADAVTMTYALGTLAFSYSLLFMSHQTTAVLIFAAFFVVWRSSQGRHFREARLAAAGGLAALAVAAEYTSALCAGVLVLYVVLTSIPRTARGVVGDVAAFGAGALPILALLMLYHAHVFGGPLETGYRHLADAAYQPWHQGGFLGIKAPEPRAFFLSLFSPLRGLFALSPVLLAGFVGLRLLWNAESARLELRAIGIFSSVLVGGYLYFTASFSYASWGWTTGPRHLTGLVPFLLLPLALVLARSRGSRSGAVTAGLAVASILVSGALTSINYIPDDVSEAVFGLFAPLAARMDLVPSTMNVLGVVNPWGGWICLALIVAVAAFVGWLLLRGPAWRPRLAVCCATAVLFLALHRAAFQDTSADRGALQLLSRDWLAPAGVPWRFWSTNGRE